MANNNKNAAKAAAQQKPAPKTTQQAQEDFAKVVKSASKGGLTGDSKVLLASLIDKRWVNNPNLPAEVIDGANILTDSLMADVIVTNIVEGKEMFALIVRKDENKYASIVTMLGSMGITVPAFKELPAPSQEQLDEANIKLLPAETRVVNIDKSQVSQEAIEQKKAEIANENKNPTNNPTEVKTAEDLKASLLAQLTSATLSPDKRIQTAINFLSSYKKIQANKSENKEEELKKVNEMSRSALLREVIEIVGKCPFAINGIGKMLHGTVVATGSPISAFCLYRRSSTNEAGVVANPDDFIADIVKMLIVWTCKTNIEHAERTIAEMERALKKENGASKKASETVIKAKKEEIEANNDIMNIMNNPSMEIVDKLIDNFNSEDKNDDYKVAHRLVKNIKDSYYKDIEMDDSNQDAILKNCQQHAGVILNMFRDSLDSTPTYSIANLVDIPVAEKKEEGTTEKEQSKNE